MRFNFTGNLGFNSLDSKNPYLRTGKKNGKEYQSLNLTVSAAKNNRAYCEMFGMERDVIITWDKDGERLEIPWDERFDDDTVDRVGRKYILSFDGNRYEYITEKDFIHDFVSALDMFRGKKFTVTGDVRKDFYNGNVRDRFQIRNIYEAPEDAKNSLNINGVFYYTKDSVDLADWKKEKRVVINGWVKQYIDKKNGTKFVPQCIVFDCSRVDFENERHLGQVAIRLSVLGLKFEDGEVKNTLKSKTVYSALVEIKYHNGAEEIAFDENSLTNAQKEQIKYGLKTLDDFRPSGSTYGNRVTEYRYINVSLRGEYSDGAIVDPTTSIKELEENIYTPIADENFDNVLKGNMNEPVNDDGLTDAEEDLW